MPRKKLFGSAFIDEVALFEEAKKYQSVELTHTLLKKIENERGLDLATVVFYEYLCQKHHNFIDAINSQKLRATSSGKSIKLIIMPGMFYKEYPEIGGDGLFIKTIAEKFNIECELVDVNSRGSILKNKDILKDKLLKEKHDNVWIVSFSKGSTETRLCLEELYSEKFPNNIKGWISISGLVKGTSLWNHKHRNPVTSAIWRATAKILGIEHSLSREMSSNNPLLQKGVLLPSHLEVIHIMGVPLPSHLQPSLIKRYQKLAHSGPNDGIIMLSDFLGVSGNVYPLWGADHFLRLNHISALIYRILNYINTK